MMNTTLKSILPGSLLLLAQAPIAGAILLATLATEHYWNTELEFCQLPLATQAALDYGLAIPIATAALSLVAAGVGWRKKSPGYGLLFALAAGEAVALALFVAVLSLPAVER